MMIKGLCYSLFTPVFGYLLDSGLGGLGAMAFGNFITAMAFIFLGPIPSLDIISGNLWMTKASTGNEYVMYFVQTCELRTNKFGLYNHLNIYRI